MFGSLKTKQQHNINCINEILGLNIPQVTTAVRNAIRKYNIFDGDRPNNADLLCIVFECLTSYLENLNLQRIRANEQSLSKEINQIVQILQIVNVKTSLQYVDYRFRISNVISKKVSNNMVSLTLSGVYLEAEKVFKNKEKNMYTKMLELITSVTKVTNETPENSLSSNQLNFWFQDVIPIIFDKNKDIQNSAIRAVEAVLPFLQLSSYQEHPNWSGLEKLITNEFSDVVIVLREKGDSLWYKMWNILVKLLNKKLLKGSAMINKFLAICEHGYKSLNYTTRAETFLCWKVLLEIYSQDANYLSAKRIKLLLIPFKPPAKSPEIAVNKFLVWWSLICKVENQIDQYYDTILVPFLWFSFGLSEKPILSKTVDIGTRQEVYPELIVLATTALINLLGPVNDATSSLCKPTPIERIQAPLVFPSLLENVGQFLINACGEATFLLKNIELVDAIPVCDNLWANMMHRMNENSDPTLTELLIQNLTILTNASKNDELAKKLVTRVARTVLSSKNLIPINLNDEATYVISKRIALLLTNNVIQFNDNALKKIVDNVFTFSTDPKRLHSQFQQILALLRLQKVSSSVQMGVILWHKVANYIQDNLTADVDANKEIIYGYIEWVVKNSNIDQLPIFLSAWKNLVRLLLNNESDDTFWHRINEILRSVTDETDSRNYRLVTTLFELIKPEGAFPSKFKTVIETVVKSRPSSLSKELQPLIDEINKFSEQISGEYSAATYQSLKELVVIVKAKFDISLRNQFGVFNKFRKNFEKFTESQNLPEKPTKRKDDEFVFIPSKWQFRPDNLTEHQKEKLKEKRVDIPALYNDMSQSQDSHSISLKPWTPKKQSRDMPEEPQVDKCDVNNGQPSSDITDDDLVNATINQPSQSQTETMASTTLPDDKTNFTNNNVNQSTPSKVDEGEKKRRRVQYELNKLQMSIANADQYSNQARTRRMSINITKPAQRLRKRAATVTGKTNPIPVKRTRQSAGYTDNSESESSEVIEASQTLSALSTTRRTRQRKSLSSKTQVVKNVFDPEKFSVNEIEMESTEENLLLDGIADSRSIGEQTTPNNEEVVFKQTDVAMSDAVPEESKETLCTTERNDSVEVKNADVSVETLSTTQDTDSVEVKDANESVVENKSIADILAEKSDEVAIPQESNDHSPIEDAHSEVVASVHEVALSSPGRKHSNEDSLASNSIGIITSPSSNKDCFKTTELLNNTLNISPILHPKTSSADQTIETKDNPEEAISKMECCNENIDTDQIKRTELDNLIKTPLDSPMLPIQQISKPLNSAPQLHKDTKRKFQLQGRGAQLLQLMNIRKVEDSSLLKAKAPVHVSVSETITTLAETIPPSTNNLLTYEDILATNKDLFRFSKVLPSPLASPSSSIMKRNVNEIADFDDIESPNQKRKRVSFHDPPVSATKEFIRFAEEVNPNRNRSNRINMSPLHVRNVLTRKCRTDSLNEIKKFELPFDEIAPENKSESSMKSLTFSATDDDDEASALPLITFSNKDEVLQHVCDEYPMEDVVGKYFGSGRTLNDPSLKLFANQLTNLMKNDETKRKLVLEDMAENFPKEFLDVAFQENLTSTVIELISSKNMLNYVADQAKTDDSLKSQLMDKFASVIADATTSTTTEMTDDFYKLLLEIISHKMSDKQLLDVLDILFEKRRTNSCS